MKKPRNVENQIPVFLVGSLVLAASLSLAGCSSDSDPSNGTFDARQVAFCAKVVSDSARTPVAGKDVYVTASVLDKSTSEVMDYEGRLTTDMSGFGCVQLQTVNIYEQRLDPKQLELKSLRATVDEGGQPLATADGVITSASMEPKTFPYVEAFFDLSNPDPGPPGQLAMLELMRSSFGSLLGSPARTARLGAQSSTLQKSDGGSGATGAPAGSDANPQHAARASAAI